MGYEAPMSHKHYFEALNRSIRDILAVRDRRNASLPFGGEDNVTTCSSVFISAAIKGPESVFTICGGLGSLATPGNQSPHPCMRRAWLACGSGNQSDP